MLNHIVFFKFHEPVADNAKRVQAELQGLLGKISQLKNLKAGVDILRTPRSYDLALITQFDSVADLEAYQIHPLHVEVKHLIKALALSTASVDYLD